MTFTYDKSKIGKRIASGGDRNVFMYGADKVIKISSLSFLAGKKLHNKLVHDYLVCSKYFKNFILETTDASPSPNKHVEIQPYIKGEMLRKKHMGKPGVLLQLQNISKSLKQMVEDQHPPLDLVGNLGMISPCLSNILIDDSNKLWIIDTTLLEGKTVMPIGIILELLLPIIKARQRYLLNLFLK